MHVLSYDLRQSAERTQVRSLTAVPAGVDVNQLRRQLPHSTSSARRTWSPGPLCLRAPPCHDARRTSSVVQVKYQRHCSYRKNSTGMCAPLQGEQHLIKNVTFLCPYSWRKIGVPKTPLFFAKSTALQLQKEFHNNVHATAVRAMI